MKISHSTAKNLNGKPYRVGIILSRFNDHLGEELLQHTQEKLLKLDVSKQNLKIFRVPGALEIPVTAQVLIDQDEFDILIALGIVIKGETPHFEHVSNECHAGLMKVSIENRRPIIFGVLTVLNEKQAKDRIDPKKLNKGAEFAETAIEMAMLMNELK